MSCQSTPPTPPPLTDEQKGRICGILSVGCDRQTAADFVGCSLAEIRQTMRLDADFLANVRRAEASIELSHMRNVQELAKEKKDWRASVWWLECRSPERFARRSGTVTARQLKAFVAILVDMLSSEVSNADDRARIIARLRQLAESVEQLIHDIQANAAEVVATAIEPVDTANESGRAQFAAAGLLGLHEED
jgi:hypothetical protein